MKAVQLRSIQVGILALTVTVGCAGGTIAQPGPGDDRQGGDSIGGDSAGGDTTPGGDTATGDMDMGGDSGPGDSAGGDSAGGGDTVCIPLTCSEVTGDCGLVSDGCMGTIDLVLDCGAAGCTPPATCGGAGPNLCGDPPVDMVTPNGGETWNVGDVQTLEWSATGSPTVSLSASYDDGATWELIATGLVGAGTYPWTVPNNPTSSARVRVQTQSGALDESDANFTILLGSLDITSPTSATTWAPGSTESITWTSTNFTGAVDLSYTVDGSSFNSIATDEPNDGTYSWTVPNEMSSTVQIRISAHEEGPTDLSDAFTIAAMSAAPRICVHPSGGLAVADPCWQSAQSNLATALGGATSGDEVWVGGDGSTIYAGNFAVPAGVHVYGGFAGGETERSQRSPSTQRQTLDGLATGSVVTLTSGAILDGLTLTNGSVMFPGGGGVRVEDDATNVIIRDVQIVANSASFEGAGISIDGGDTLIQDVLIDDCDAPFGGAVYILGGTVTIENTDFTNNDIDFFGEGPALDAAGPATVFVSNSRFFNNYGGASGAISIVDGVSLTVSNSLFFDNTALRGGAIGLPFGGDLTLTHSLFVNNASANPTVYSQWNSSNIEVYNNIFVDNPNTLGLDLQFQAGTSQVGHNVLSQGGLYDDAGGNIFKTVPFENLGAGNFRPVAGSPVIDAANAAFSSVADLDGSARQDDGGTIDTGAGSPTFVDIGPYEFGGASPLRVVTPSGGETWNPGESQTVSWIAATPTTLTIQFSPDGGATFASVATGVASTLGTTMITVPNLGTTQGTIRVLDESTGDSALSAGSITLIGTGDVWVNSNGTSRDGLTPATGFATVQEGIDAAGFGQTVRVVEDTYRATVANEALVKMKPGVDVIGGHDATGLYNPTMYPTTLEGEVLAGGNASHVVVAADALLRGFTIRGGIGSSDAYPNYGGGIIVWRTAAEVRDCVIESNDSPNGAGIGVVNTGASLLIVDSVLSDNGPMGAAIYVHTAGFAEVIDTDFLNNTRAGIYTRGGGVVTVDGGRYEGNGNEGTFNLAGAAGHSIRNVVTEDNRTSLQVSGITLVVENSLFIVNRDPVRLSSSADVTFTNCVFDRTTINNMFFTSAIFGTNSDVTLINSTLYGDYDTFDYEMINTGSATLENTIVWHEGPGPTTFGAGTTVTVDYSSLPTDPGTGTGNVFGNPMFVDPANGDLTLSLGSAAVDSANGDVAPTTDVLGQGRVDLSGGSPPGVGTPDYVDMGAYELQP